MVTNKTAVMAELALLVRVVEGGSFSAAARSIDMTPSAVSRAMGRLESALGTQILRRTTRQLALTDAGEVV